MAYSFADLQNIGKDNAAANVAIFARGLRSVTQENTDYSKRSFDNVTSLFEKLRKSPDKAIELQGEYAKAQFEDFTAQMKKIGDIYAGMGKEVFKSVEAAVEDAKDVAQH